MLPYTILLVLVCPICGIIVELEVDYMPIKHTCVNCRSTDFIWEFLGGVPEPREVKEW